MTTRIHHVLLTSAVLAAAAPAVAQSARIVEDGRALASLAKH
jgi:hypothetical protein